MNIQEFKALPELKKHQYIKANFPANTASISQRFRVYGHGINDEPYVAQPLINGKKVKCPAYVAWESMLRRAYDKSHIAKYPHHAGTTVCKDWKHFSMFLEWWKENNYDGFNLNKRLIIDSKEYSPESCVYVPHWLKMFVQPIEKERKSGLPVGVRRSGNGYVAFCTNPKTNEGEYLGSFADIKSAREKYLSRKLGWALMLKAKTDLIDERIYPRLVELIKSA